MQDIRGSENRDWGNQPKIVVVLLLCITHEILQAKVTKWRKGVKVPVVIVCCRGLSLEGISGQWSPLVSFPKRTWVGKRRWRRGSSPSQGQNTPSLPTLCNGTLGSNIEPWTRSKKMSPRREKRDKGSQILFLFTVFHIHTETPFANKTLHNQAHRGRT